MTVWWSLVWCSLACTFQQNDLKRKLEQLTSEASKTRKNFEDTLKRNEEERREAEIRRSQETLNKSTKAGKKEKKSTASKTKGANKKKTASKKKTVPKTLYEEYASLSLSSSEDETKKTTSKKTATDKTASKKSTPRRKTASKPAGVIDMTSLPSEDDQDDPEGATIKKHLYDKETELYTVRVSWEKTKKVEWQFFA